MSIQLVQLIPNKNQFNQYLQDFFSQHKITINDQILTTAQDLLDINPELYELMYQGYVEGHSIERWECNLCGAMHEHEHEALCCCVEEDQHSLYYEDNYHLIAHNFNAQESLAVSGVWY